MNVIEFRRVSTQEQGNDDRAGLPRQEEANKLTANRYNLKITKIFELTDVSGASVLETPEWAELVSLLNSRAFAGVVVSDLDRLGRPTRFESYKYLDVFTDTGTKIFLPSGPLDPATQSGYLMSVIHSAIAGNELTQIMKRVSEAKEIKRKLGKHPNSDITLPYGVGYDWDAEKFYYKEPDCQRIKELFRIFHDEGVHNLRELERLSGFHHRTISNLLRNKLYIGIRAYEFKRSREKRTSHNGRQADKRKIRRGLDEIISVKVINEPLVDDSVFWKVQEILTSLNGEYHNRRSFSGKRFILSGLLRCEICGKKIYTSSGGRNHKKDYYVCCSKKTIKYSKEIKGTKCDSGYMSKSFVENAVISLITEKLTEEDFLKKMITLALSEKQNKKITSEITILEKAIKDLKRQKERCLQLYIKGKFNIDEVNVVAQKITDEIRGLELRLVNLQNNFEMTNTIDFDKITSSIVFTLFDFPFWSASQKRNFLFAQMPEIFVSGKGITGFTLRFSNLGIHLGTGS